MQPERFHRIAGVLDRRQPDLTVLMERVHKPHNFSAILRNCDAVGVLEAHVIPPEGGMDLHHGTSAGTRKWIRVRRHPDVATATAWLKGEGFRLIAAHPSAASVDYRDVDFTEPVALMMGAELHGVSEEGLAVADVHVSLPMRGMVHSLNVSVATALLLYEAHRQRDRAGMYAQSRVPPETREPLLFEWAYPLLSRRLRAKGLPYPRLDQDGNIVPDREGT